MARAAWTVGSTTYRRTVATSVSRRPAPTTREGHGTSSARNGVAATSLASSDSPMAASARAAAPLTLAALSVATSSARTVRRRSASAPCSALVSRRRRRSSSFKSTPSRLVRPARRNSSAGLLCVTGCASSKVGRSKAPRLALPTGSLPLRERQPLTLGREALDVVGEVEPAAGAVAQGAQPAFPIELDHTAGRQVQSTTDVTGREQSHRVLHG